MRVRSETVERAREWAEAKEKEKADIARISSEAREKAEAEAKARVREKSQYCSEGRGGGFHQDQSQSIGRERKYREGKG